MLPSSEGSWNPSCWCFLLRRALPFTAGMHPAAGGHRCHTLLLMLQINPHGQDCCWGTPAGKEFQWVGDKLV